MTVTDETTVAPRKCPRPNARLLAVAALVVMCVALSLAVSLAPPAQRTRRSHTATRRPSPYRSVSTGQPAAAAPASPAPLPATPPPSTRAPRPAAPPPRAVPLMSNVWRSTRCLSSTMRFADFTDEPSEEWRLAADPATQYLVNRGNSAAQDRFVELRLRTAEKTRNALGMHNATDFCVFGWEGEFSHHGGGGAAAEDTRTVRSATGSSGSAATTRLEAAGASRLALFSGPQNRSRLCVDDDYIVGTEGFTGIESSYVDFMVRPCAVSAEEARRVGGTREAMISTWHAATLGRNGLGLVIAGDSVLRQMLMRYVAVERGQVEGTEHQWHGDLLYVKYGAQDRVTPLVSKEERELSLDHFTRQVLQTFYPAYYDGRVRPRLRTAGSETYGADAFDALQVKMTILYMWMVNPKQFDDAVAPQLNHPRPPSLFTYFGYHDGNENASEAITKIVSDFRASNSRRPVGDPNRNFLILSTVRSNGEKPLQQRNDNTRNLFTQHSLRQGSVYLMDYDTAAAAAGALVKTDGDRRHTSCNFIPMFPYLVNAAHTTHDNCRDAMGFNALLWLTHIMRLAIHDTTEGC